MRREVWVRPKDFPLLPAEAVYLDPSPSRLPVINKKQTQRKLQRRRYLNASFVLFPYLPTLHLKFVCFLFWVGDPLLLISCSWNCGLEIAFEPRIEASIISPLERRTLGGKALRHSSLLRISRAVLVNSRTTDWSRLIANSLVVELKRLTS